MSHTYTLSQQNHWNNRSEQWKLPLYFSKLVLHHIKHFVDGMLSTGFSDTLTDIHRESLQDRDRRTLSHFLTHGNWNASYLKRIIQHVAFQQMREIAQRGHGPFFVILDDTVCEKPSLRHRLRIGFKGLRFNILISKVSPSTGMLLSKPCFVRVTGFSPLPQNVTIRKQKQNRFGL
ncbi:hypothetical protein D1872_176830 [compost metagenome]